MREREREEYVVPHISYASFVIRDSIRFDSNLNAAFDSRFENKRLIRRSLYQRLVYQLHIHYIALIVKHLNAYLMAIY